jgi:hypothetical protein
MSRATYLTNRILSKIFGIKILRTGTISALSESSVKYLQNSQQCKARVETLAELLRPKKAAGISKIRLGNRNDGGYVCLDDFTGLEAAVSLGIAGDVTWDLDVASRVPVVFQYDHTVPASPVYNEKFVFNRIKVGSKEGKGIDSIDSIVSKNNLSKPASVLAKIDIEGDEWDALLAASPDTLKVFSQLMCEFHHLDRICEESIFEKVFQVFDNLSRIFQVVHIHGNNFGPLLVMSGHCLFPEILEITFANKERFSFAETDETFPGNLDAPNNPNKTDYRIDFYLSPD